MVVPTDVVRRTARLGRVLAAALVGLWFALMAFGAVQLAFLVAYSVTPRTAAWEPMQVPLGVLLSVGAALMVTRRARRIGSLPLLVRRMGCALLVLGGLVVLGGFSLFFVLPAPPPRHPGAHPAGDVGAGALAMIIAAVGAVTSSVGLVLAVSGAVAAWLERRRERRGGGTEG